MTPESGAPLGPRERPEDVVGQGPEEEPAGAASSWPKKAGIAVAVVVVLAGLSRAGLLSSDQPSPAPEPTASGSATAVGTSNGPRLVARAGERLVLGARGAARPGSRLPPGLPADARLVPVRPGGTTADESADIPGPVIGVHDGRLFRADADRRRSRDLGPADLVVAGSPGPARAMVLRDGSLQEVEVSTGATTDPDPYPGFSGGGWAPVGLLGGAGVGGVVLSRPAAGGDGISLALAYPRALVESTQREARRDLGNYGALLGIADDWVITLDRSCPGPACRLEVVTVTRDTSTSRPVAPPAGWTFLPGPTAGRTHEALVPVRSADGDSVALARLVPGGDNALLVGGTDRVVLDAGLVDRPDGSVYLLREPAGGGDPVPMVWDPDSPSAVVPLLPPGTFPAGSRLVCVCG